MERILPEVPEISRTLPEGVVSVPMGPLGGESKLVPEFFYREAVPPPEVLQPPTPVQPPPELPVPAQSNPPA
jgi:hypothetical protein